MTKPERVSSIQALYHLQVYLAQMKNQFCTNEIQFGTNEIQCGTNENQFGTNEIQFGTNEI